MTPGSCGHSDRAAYLRAGTRGVPFERALALAMSAIGLISPVLPAAAASDAPPSAAELKRLSIEELMDIEVSSVSKSRQRLGGAPAAIAVVTNEQIRRSGATSIPEALRGVPGIHVAQRTASVWAVSSRGFASANSEKLLVLTDTRSVYTPLYSGVFWDVQDYLLQDIDRIEVIRGPGGALWGSNAVNGVINIVTKNAQDTQDLYLEAGSGAEHDTLAGARYGGRIGERGFFRVSGKYSARDGTYHPGAQSDDDWQLANFSFRSDWGLSADDSLTVQGGYYEGNIGQVAPSIDVIGRPPIQGELEAAVRGGNVLARWVRSIGPDSQFRVRFYYDQTHRNDPAFRDDLDTIDLDVYHAFMFADRHHLSWGLNYRYTNNRNDGKGLFALAPADSQDAVISAFVQDKIILTRSLDLMLGSKFEDNQFSGFEVQPSARLAWDISAAHDAWVAVSRAVRVPTRLERDVAVDASDPAGDPVVRLLGNAAFDSEEILAYEAGYRWRPVESFFVDLAAFYNRYDGLASLELGTPFADPNDGRTIVPIVNRNLTDGSSHGLEALVSYSPVPHWRLSATYSYLEMRLDPRGEDLNRGRFYEGATPAHQFGFRSLLDLPHGLQLDMHLRHLDDVRQTPEIVTGEGIGGYTELNVRLAWQAWRKLEISLVGQNLLHDRHIEWGAPEARGAIERTVYAKVAWGF